MLPSEELCYGIKNYLFEAYTRISSGNISVHDILRKYQGSVEERLMLKHSIILGRSMNELKINPGSLLWVVRYFIDSFPTPILSENPNQEDYLWTEITKLCKTSVASYVTMGRYNTALVDLIAKKLSKLQESFPLFVNLFDTIRMLAVLPEGEPRINKVSAFVLGEYFSSSLFVRPFHPGSNDKISKQYSPITVFIIFKWLEIKNSCIQFRQNNFEVNDYRRMSRRMYTKRQYARRSTASNVDHNFDTTCDYLQDVACQTEDLGSELQENCFKKCCCGVLRKYEEKQKSETKIIYIKQKCCCAYGTNYKSVLSPENYFDLEDEQRSSDLPNSLLECKQIPSTVSVTGVDDEIVSKIPYDKIHYFDPIEKEIAGDTIKKKATKVGWSYTSNFPIENFEESGSKHDSLESVSNIGWNLKSGNSDSIENMRKSLNVELKEKFTQKAEEQRRSEEFHVRKCSSKLSLPKTWGSISKESRISVDKIKHKFNIFNAFADKRNNSKKSLICKQAESKIKYKRIGSENSIDKC